jgi:hypothetical protein
LEEKGLHLNLDGAWDGDALGLRKIDLKAWGPKLRYCAPRSVVEAFYREIEGIQAPFLLYGSGDFHYLTALFLRRFREKATVVSFDNHPDWDRRPPRWSCGGWTVRALEEGRASHVRVWGCGNFELQYPHRLFAARVHLRSGRLEPYAWAERQTPDVCSRFRCVTRGNWQEVFSDFAEELTGENVYITVDMDCLRAEDAVTNWENGLFSAADLAWALALLNRKARVTGGDICGAYSRPVYARLTQRIAGAWDHPRVTLPCEEDIRSINKASLAVIWPALVSGRAQA